MFLHNAFDDSYYSNMLKLLLSRDGMIGSEEHDQANRPHAAAASAQRGFIAGDKEILLLSSIIYVVDCITFLDATQLWSS